MIDRHNMTESLFAASDLHQKVLAAARKALLADGCFHKEDIMKEAKDVFLIDAVRWDWIVRKLTADKSFPGGGVELISVAEFFFKASAKTKAAMNTDYTYKHEDSFPGKYVAQGYGKRTAGWVLATFAEGRFALYKAELSKKNADGRTKQNQALGTAVTGKLISEGKTAKVAAIAQASGIPAPVIPPKIASK